MKPVALASILLAACLVSRGQAQIAETTAPEQKGSVYYTPAEDPKSDSDKPGTKNYQSVKVETKDSPYLVVPHRMTKAAWLGVSASAPSPVLRRQLKLPEGTGLVVDFVQPKSPAEEIGLKQYDLLIKLDDQLLINSEQLAVLVRLHKPGSDIELTIMREGQRQMLSGKLAEHEVPELLFEFQEFHPNFEQEFHPNFELNVNPNMNFNKPLITPPTVDPKLWQQDSGSGSPAGVEHSLTWLDGAKQITLKMSNDHKRLLILDRPSGKVMFEGSIESLEQSKGLPDEARDALKRLRQFLKTQPEGSDRANRPLDPTSPKDAEDRPR